MSADEELYGDTFNVENARTAQMNSGYEFPEQHVYENLSTNNKPPPTRVIYQNEGNPRAHLTIGRGANDLESPKRRVKEVQEERTCSVPLLSVIQNNKGYVFCGAIILVLFTLTVFYAVQSSAVRETSICPSLTTPPETTTPSTRSTIEESTTENTQNLTDSTTDANETSTASSITYHLKT